MRSARFVTVAVCATLALDSMAYAVVLPALALSFGSGAAVGALFAVYSLAQLISAPLLGRLSDRTGRRPVLAACQAFTVVALGLLVLPGYAAAMASRLLDGVTAGNSPVAYATALEQHEQSRWNAVFGWLASASGVGVLAGIGIATFLDGALAASAVVGMVIAAGSVLVTLVCIPAVPARVAAPIGRVRIADLRRSRSALLGGAAQSAAVMPLPAVLVAVGHDVSTAVDIGFAALIITALAQTLLVPVLLRMRTTPAVLMSGVALSAGAVVLGRGLQPVIGAALLLSGAVAVVALGRTRTVHRLADRGVGTSAGLTTTATTAGQLAGPLLAYAALEVSFWWSLAVAVAFGVAALVAVEADGDV